jgi:hypothetical protein
VIVRRDDQPRADQPYVMIIDGRERRGVTDRAGLVEQPIPASARSVTLRFDGDDATPPESFHLLLRHLDPVTEPSGQQARLANLGYYLGPVDGERSDALAAALVAFQRDRGLEPTAEPDEETRAALLEAHGC